MSEVFGLSHHTIRRPSRDVADNPGSYLPPGQLRNDFVVLRNLSVQAGLSLSDPALHAMFQSFMGRGD